jgi:tetraacyldisaccharide 4'-kinase
MPLATPPPPPTSPWQRLYSGAHRLRRHWYQAREKRLPRPVVSIGNLHFGGAGKTPMTAALAAHLRDRGLAVCILSRGYGSRRGAGGVRVVSTGAGPLLGPEVAGDEPVLLAGELPGVAVVVDPDRYEAGLHALHHLNPPPTLFLLDDGFSHLGLARDLDLLVFPAADPWAGGRLLPSGRLREPLAAVSRASTAILTGVDPGAVAGAGDALAEALRPHGFTGRGFASVTRPGEPRRMDGTSLAPGEKVFLLSAVARPEGFAAQVRKLGFEIAGELSFPDHHPYPVASLARIAAAYWASGATAVLTTSKDRVKLLGRLDLPASEIAELPIQAEPEPAFWTWLDAVENLGDPRVSLP